MGRGRKSCRSPGSVQSARGATETCAFHSCTYTSAFPLSPLSLPPPTARAQHSNLFGSSYTTATHAAGHNCNSVQTSGKQLIICCNKGSTFFNFLLGSLYLKLICLLSGGPALNVRDETTEFDFYTRKHSTDCNRDSTRLLIQGNTQC